MKIRSHAYLFILLGIVSACTSKKEKIEISGVRKIWSNQTYCAFTDLIKYNSIWYCVFREAISHEGSNGGIRILKSSNTFTWESDTILYISDVDLRDPKLMIGFNNELILYTGAKGIEFKNVLWSLDAGTKKWRSSGEMNVTGAWLWRIKQHGNQMFSMAYEVTNRRPLSSLISLYTTDKQLFPKFKLLRKSYTADGCPTECSILIQPDTKDILMLTRRDCDNMFTYLGISKPPYDSIDWHNLNIIVQSPNMVFVEKDIYVSGRTYNPGDETTLFKLNLASKQLERIATLPSKIDTGYPGMFYEDGVISISYYSSESDGSRSIYFGRYKIK